MKFWYLDEDDEPIRTLAGSHSPTSTKQDIYLMSNEAADLSKIDSRDFIGVVCKGTYIYTLSTEGKLCIFNENRKVEKWMNIKVKMALGLNICGFNLLCNCSDGIIRVFHTETLQHILTLPKPPTLGSANQMIGAKKVKNTVSKEEAKYADCIALDMDEEKERIIAVYSDKMVLIWDLTVKEKVKVMRAFLSHKGAISDLEIMPSSTAEITKFVTCSTDKTIRFWNFYDYYNNDLQKLVKRNIYCKELEKIIYVSQEFDHFKLKISESGDETVQTGTSTDDIDLRMQLKCIKPSPDGKHIACGDATGHVRVYDIETSEELSQFQAHDQEVVCLDYSPFVDKDGNYILASGSRDRLIHIYSSGSGYQDINNLEGHSSSIVSVKFAFDPDEKDESKRLKLITCGADKATIFRKVEEPTNITTYHKEVTKNNKVVSMEIKGNKLV